jgi:hypothetical protein
MINWQPKKRAENDYSSAVYRIFERLVTKYPVQLINRTDFLWHYAVQAAARMVTGLYAVSASNWQAAARESGRTDVIYAALKKEMSGPVGRRVRELIRENAKLIVTLPPSLARKMTQMAVAQQQAGGRAEELLSNPLLAKMTRASALRLARTEISKSNAALQQARSEQLDLPAYVWQTSQDARVRLSHKRMQGVLVFWGAPPAPELLVGEKSQGHYQAGSIFNCRCYSAPVVRLSHLKWPHKVYHQDRIQYMTLSQVQRLSAMGMAA